MDKLLLVIAIITIQICTNNDLINIFISFEFILLSVMIFFPALPSLFRFNLFFPVSNTRLCSYSSNKKI